MRKNLTIACMLILVGCGGTGLVTDTTQDTVPVVLADEAAALAVIRDIREAQTDFLATQRRYALFIDELVDALMIPDEPPWAGSGYLIRIRPTAAADGYSATVTAPPDAADVRSFYVDDSGVIRWALGEAATSDSPELRDESDTGEVGPD